MLKVERTFVADEINIILNDPSIRQGIGGDGKSFSDISPHVENENNYVFLCSDQNGLGAAYMLFKFTDVIWECHTAALPHFRGKQAIKAAKICIDHIFEDSECLKLIGRTPVDNKGANKFNRMVGFELEGVCKKSWLKPNGDIIDQNYWGLSKG